MTIHTAIRLYIFNVGERLPHKENRETVGKCGTRGMLRIHTQMRRDEQTRGKSKIFPQGTKKHTILFRSTKQKLISFASKKLYWSNKKC